jgi:hypothetical protein
MQLRPDPAACQVPVIAELPSMHCLLCHEKIPRLRAWTGKSEFCCDEHADLYKKQTMDRLLVDDSAAKSAAPALPIPQAPVPSVDHILLREQPKKPNRVKPAPQTPEVDELWKLAERLSGDQGATPEPETPIAGQSQSADEALAALQALAAEAKHSGGDLLDEFSNMESSLEELPPLESLPFDIAAELEYGELAEAPELELDALEAPAAQASAVAENDVPELLLEALAEDRYEALEPPELAADFDAEPAAALEPPDAALEELLVAPEAFAQPSSDLSDPPEPADFDLAAADEAALAGPAVGRADRRAPSTPPKLRPATELQSLSPRPSLPEGRYALKPWTDALAIAGPDRSSLLSPIKFVEMRKSSLNGTDSAKFDPVLFRASERMAAVRVPISEPNGSSAAYSSQYDALMPRTGFAWPMPLHAALITAEMSLDGTPRGMSVGESIFAVKQPALSAEFLNSVAFQSSVLEPRSSTVLSLRERDAFSSAAAEEEASGSKTASAARRSDGRDGRDGGERVNVADLF